MTPLMTELLERGRDAFNARYEAARRGGTAIDGEMLLAQVSDVIAPIVDAAAACRAEAAWPTLNALYEVSIVLFAAGQLGPTAKTSVVRELWTSLLPRIPRLVASHPRRVVAALSNAAINVAAARHARPSDWLTRITRAADVCEDLPTFLTAAQIAAWLAGMVEYRAPALDALRTLPAGVAAAVLGLDDAAKAQATITALVADPWLSLDAESSDRQLRLAAQLGAFRGFGGDFLRPPTVWNHTGDLFASDGVDTWQLLADRFGQTLIRRAAPPAGATPAAGLHLAPNGDLRWNDERQSFPALADASSWATDGKSIVVTLKTSHHLFILANVSADASAEVSRAG